ncbi:MAG: HAD family hydrolase [Chloroflexota bacterium]|nr:HAD family hydrolase [Chloroflexota bacterium]
MLKAVLFDLDDTLLDWSGFHGDWAQMEAKHLRNVFNWIANEIHPLDDYDAYAAEFHTRTRDVWASARMSLRAPNLGSVLIEAAVALGVPPNLLDMRRVLEVYEWDAVAGTVMFPDVPEAIQLLTAHNIKVGIVTNAYQPMWIRDVEITTHGIMPFFPTCRISAADVGYLKPHPAIFQTALNCVGVKPQEAVFVGDDPEADVAGAQAAGLTAVLRLSPHRQRSFDGKIVPDARIYSLAELPALLDKWFVGWRS